MKRLLMAYIEFFLFRFENGSFRSEDFDTNRIRNVLHITKSTFLGKNFSKHWLSSCNNAAQAFYGSLKFYYCRKVTNHLSSCTLLHKRCDIYTFFSFIFIEILWCIHSKSISQDFEPSFNEETEARQHEPFKHECLKDITY